ncbi:type III-B CRISPR module RAMP protein Cmr4 [Neisseria sp. HMSC064F04]|uniref:type III-B CRISPR module RAMP protein Cmr4 n=1 Tax=Neisseria mucosa TaxID=488 RepID=UPI0008A5B6EF|nr:type III-B CRISPR module RAMP protein Cmr4 [Neisseria mucosa]OFN34740.1 type III-B CRISPR module RAMP protein Cmr4 [Neisseria sp. HMSC059F02]OHR43633.1 type III-B CRISPR module RAMP protein Cmr4 [Neisseria sp. HMSC064F04]
MNTRIFHLHALSALHVGTGQGIGAVDLPIARSRATNLPLVPGSALKGVLRDEAKEKWHLNQDDIQALFGADSQADKENIHASAAAFGDAHLLLLPIRSFAGTVAFATCPFILQRYARDVRGLQPESPKVPVLKDSASVPDNTVLRISGSQIALEDLDIDSETSAEAKQWAEHIAAAVYPENTADYQAWREQLIQRFIILPDSTFSFLADTATEIRMRIRIDRETRIVKEGALWSEENLPAESVLYGILATDKSRHRGNTKSADELSALIPAGETQIQIGGKHTVGRGLCRLVLSDDLKKGE